MASSISQLSDIPLNGTKTRMLGLKYPLGRKQFLALGITATVVLMAGYIMLLNHEERAMSDYYEKLRQTSPDVYLSKIMQARGFRSYIDEYLDIHDYSQPQKTVPPFLLGRWALFDKYKNVSDDFLPDSCLNGVEIEDGRVKFFGKTTGDYPAKYTMQGNTVTLQLDGAPATDVDVVGYGSHLHHIEMHAPESGQVLYGYMCR
ncbi:MAG: hypothetical protein P1V34_07875 [Alphaproteobacteria bacterium]|nr:hypothetical protein [Alphaproteobacteria bacterium]